MLPARQRRASARAGLGAIALTSWTLFVLAVSIPYCAAQTDAGTQVETPPASMPVVVGGQELFELHRTPLADDAKKRAFDLTAEIEKVISDPKYDLANLTVSDTADRSDIIYGDRVILFVSEADAAADGLSHQKLARKWLAAIKACVEAERAKRNFHEALDQVKLGAVKSTLLNIIGNPLFLRIGISILGLVIIAVITYSARRSIPRYFHESYKRYTVSKLAEFAAYFIGLVFLCIVFSDTLGSLAVILGAATAGIALALKELIVSMAGWLAITFGETYRVGDRIQIAGVKGDVIDVGLVRTTLMELGEWVQGDMYTGRIVRVANGTVFSGATFNYTRDLPFLWDELVLSVRMESDLAEARAIVQKIAGDVVGDYVNEAKLAWTQLKEKYLVYDEQIEPLVTMLVAESAVQFTVRYPVDFRQRRIVKDELFSGIVRELALTDGRVKLYEKK